jgi:hypothetical protein
MAALNWLLIPVHLPLRMKVARDPISGDVGAILNYQKKGVTLVQSLRDVNGTDLGLEGSDWDRRQLFVKDGRVRCLDCQVCESACVKSTPFVWTFARLLTSCIPFLLPPLPLSCMGSVHSVLRSRMPTSRSMGMGSHLWPIRPVLLLGLISWTMIRSPQSMYASC